MVLSSESYDNVIIGYWVNKGTDDTKTLEYIKKINNKKVAFFVTLRVIRILNMKKSD